MAAAALIMLARRDKKKTCHFQDLIFLKRTASKGCFLPLLLLSSLLYVLMSTQRKSRWGQAPPSAKTDESAPAPVVDVDAARQKVNTLLFLPSRP